MHVPVQDGSAARQWMFLIEMNMRYNAFLFPHKAYQTNFSLFLLALRLLFGGLLMTHGYAKLTEFVSLAVTFPDPLGIGGRYSLMLAIFGELFCSVAFVLGFLLRLSLLPMIVTMAVAFFYVHGGSLAGGELALIYLVVFVLIYLVGPGRFSVDCWMSGGGRRKR